MNTTIGDRIKELRKKASLTQKQLGELVEKDATTLGRYEKNILPVPSDVLEIMSNLFKVSVDYIVSGENSYMQFSDLKSLLTQKSIELLSLFQSLSESDQNEIIELMEFKIHRKKSTFNKEKNLEDVSSFLSQKGIKIS